MTRRTVARLVLGTVLILLGLLWILQGADLVRIQPILCVADCRPVTGGSLGWSVAGVIAVAVGLAAVAAPRLRRR